MQHPTLRDDRDQPLDAEDQQHHGQGYQPYLQLVEGENYIVVPAALEIGDRRDNAREHGYYDADIWEFGGIIQIVSAS
jgi:hypothetical protein